MTIAPEIQSLIDWEKAVGDRHGELPPAELRWLLRDEFDEELRRRGVVAEEVAAIADDRVPVAGGEIPVRVFTPQCSTAYLGITRERRYVEHAGSGDPMRVGGRFLAAQRASGGETHGRAER